MLKEFKEFAVKGNMLDLAVGFILGAAFGTVVKSLVDDILMPVIAKVFGTPDFTNLFIVLTPPETTDEMILESISAVREAGGVALGYGLFINALISFLLVGLALFFVVKAMNRLKRKQEDPTEPDPVSTGPTTEQLLIEIRDVLKSRN